MLTKATAAAALSSFPDWSSPVRWRMFLLGCGRVFNMAGRRHEEIAPGETRACSGYGRTTLWPACGTGRKLRAPSWSWCKASRPQRSVHSSQTTYALNKSRRGLPVHAGITEEFRHSQRRVALTPSARTQHGATF